ncbi:ABC transporter ATP-binding protein/permease [Candidatus Nomurabacteria bacterium]|nr:ABC transporter ATP-binding protein/permease [Candidatus Nomurabacteria bacterium]
MKTVSLIQRIFSFAKPFRKAILLTFLSVFIFSILNALADFFISKIVDFIQQNKAETLQIFLFLFLAGLFVLIRIILSVYQERREVNEIDLGITNHNTFHSVEKFFSFSTGQHLNEHSGVKQNIVNKGIGSIQNQINRVIYELFPNFAQFFVSIIVICYADWRIVIILLLATLLYFLRMNSLAKDLLPGFKEFRDKTNSSSRLTSELYRMVGLIKFETQEAKSLELLKQSQDENQKAYEKAWKPGISGFRDLRLIGNGTRFLVILILVIIFFYQKGTTTGNFFLVFIYSKSFSDSLWQMASWYRGFLMDKMNIEKFLELLEIKPEITNVENPIKPDKFEGKIEFKNVSFHYLCRKSEHDVEGLEISDEPVLHNVSFIIEAGQKVGIVGGSGSGKSTLINLIRRAFDPTHGQILVDGNDLRLLDLQIYLKNIGCVDQEVQMFDRSIRDNILFGSSNDISEDNMNELLKIARIDDFFGKLEHGLDTIVGERGAKISGGERQRLGIARALAKKPSILIFDEATSALDSTSEKLVQESIDEASKGKTAVVIAHRLSTIKNCDKILVFREGVLLAEGSHEFLLENSEYYSELVKHQTL